MRVLNRKLIRDLRQIRGQAVAIALVIASGLATFVLSLSTLQSLHLTQQTYYQRYRFADVFAHLKRAPSTLAARLAEIPGVARVQTRIVEDAPLYVRGMEAPATARLISIPDFGAPLLNELHLRQGRYLEADHPDEVLANEAFAQAHGLKPGDTVSAILNGRKQQLRIVGIALSPEYIIQMREGDILPDDRRFGVFWMGRRQLAAAFNLEGAFNDVTLSLMHHATEPAVIARLDRLTKPYGGLGAYGRDHQLSHRYLSDEIRQLRNMGLLIPAIFLGVAGFLFNVVLARLIATQREQIAGLKSFGYSHREVAGHYLKLVLLITGLGVLLGLGVGRWLGHGLTEFYTRFYRFPVVTYQLSAAVVLGGVAICCATAVTGAWGAARQVLRLPPAEAMRPEPPASFRPTIVERMGLQRFFPHAARMILRQLERRPFKSLLSCLGIALALAILILGRFSKDSLDFIMDYQFEQAQREDLTVRFIEPTSFPALGELEHLPGVIHAEPFRSLAVRLKAGHRSRRVALMGLAPHADLYRLLDPEGHPVALPPRGLVLSAKLAEVLHVAAGDPVTVEVLQESRPVRTIIVSKLIKDYIGTPAYMDLTALHRLMREGPTLSGAFLSVDARERDRLYQTLRTIPHIAGITIKKAALESFQATMAENLLRLQAFNVVFACIIAFGVVYNNARISLSERTRELATLRVLGFTRQEISAILLGELGLLSLLAIPLGLGLGYLLAAFASWTLNTELYRIPLVIAPSTDAFAVTVVLVAALFSGMVVRRRLDRLDLIAVLKSRE